jgi:hypothetical protein
MFGQRLRERTLAFKAPAQVAKQAIERLLLVFMGIALPIIVLIGSEMLLRTFPTLLPAPIRAAPKASLLDIFRSNPVRIADPELISRYRPGIVMTATNETVKLSNSGRSLWASPTWASAMTG